MPLGQAHIGLNYLSLLNYISLFSNDSSSQERAVRTTGSLDLEYQILHHVTGTARIMMVAMSPVASQLRSRDKGTCSHSPIRGLDHPSQLPWHYVSVILSMFVSEFALAFQKDRDWL